MKKYFAILSLTLFVFSCSDPEPRKPITSTSGTFFKESVERNKKILEKEESYIQKIIEKDSTHTYYPSEEGFWFTYTDKRDDTDYTPKENDLVALIYDIQTLNGKTIYSKAVIDTTLYKVDKQENLFLGLRKAVKLLKKGEKATFFFPSSLAYGYIGDQKKIGVNTPLKSTLQILEIQKSNDSITTN
ncbi:gliding motility-associated peptidyl-prolyl isomerase GldI [Neptunitalea lumnitzerae]|uniref:Peptidyl-prolyl cis-trans isomerase n=1 Tax=Neptunitalea lumnitzerae TaxID=2965509 RepID=A0ABQ5MKQ7_9FLAO|nr:gliding motility-associated peptidyl-prolyl isomerase GldI [Neptunitalea sp. Y10]GLB49886.1 hypothetical protein Y10_22540 [Neptunitalea sp. Y10]